ncbi:MAG: hypothetical protein O7F74_03925 [Bacteroidetes bacterium]|nr:hypothetical protein [Bacteroidota bacterium]
MLIGEKMGIGSTMYLDIIDDTAPFSAGVFWMADIIFGRSHIASQILSFLLVFVQCIIFNSLLIRNNVYTKNTYVPSVVYGILMSLSYEYYILSPILMSQTFILLGLNSIFSHVEYRTKKDEVILNIGVYFGIATLFYLPSLIYYIITIITFMLFTATIPRRYMLLSFGFALPVTLVSIYFYYLDGLNNFLHFYLFNFIYFEQTSLLSSLALWGYLIIPSIYFIFTLLKLTHRTRFTNFQYRLVQIMFISLLLVSLTYWITSDKSPGMFMILTPFLAFFISHFFLLVKSRLVGELSFFIFISVIVWINLGTFHNSGLLTSYMDIDPIKIAQTEFDIDVKDKSVLFTGNNLNVYKSSRMATPYLNWKLSEEILRNPNYYDNLSHIYHGFFKDLPELIIDQEGVMDGIFEMIPDLANKYEKIKDGKFRLK